MRASRLITAALVLTLIGGCGSADPQASGRRPEQSAGGSSSAAATADPTPTTATGGATTGSTAPPTDLGPPTLDTPKPPRTPSDLLPSNILVGTIRGGSASCYTMETDDNASYALVGVDDGLEPGDVVRVVIAEDSPATASCDGQPVTVVELTVVQRPAARYRQS